MAMPTSAPPNRRRPHRLLLWITAAGLLLLVAAHFTTAAFQGNLLMNLAAGEAMRNLLAHEGGDEAGLEAARQRLYAAMDAGYAPDVVLARLREIEGARWYLQSQQLKAQGLPWEQVFSYQEWTRQQFAHTILEPWQSAGTPNWYLLGSAAGRMQLWSLAVYFYRHALAGDPGEVGQVQAQLGEALLQAGQFAEAESHLQAALDGNAAPAAPVAWHLAQTLAAQQRWDEAARRIERVAGEAPLLLQTAEAAALARQVEAHAALTVPATMRTAWAQAGTNLVVNGSFEQGYTPWGMWPAEGANSTIDDTRAFTGLKSFRVQFDGSRDVDYYQVSQSLPVEPGATYELSGQLWADEFTGHLGIEARGGDWFAGNTEQVHGTTGGWKPVVLRFTVPAGVTDLTVTLRRYGGNGLVSGTVWIDDIALTRM